MRGAAHAGGPFATREMTVTRTSEVPTPRWVRTRSPSRWSAVLVAALVVLGAAVALYPATASWFAERAAVTTGERYSETVAALEPADRADRLRDADEYNALLGRGVLPDPFDASTPHTVVDPSDPYWSLLDDGDGVMARIRIPAIDLDLPVYHGTADDVLRRGVGHLQGTAMPIGGQGRHTVLTGHRGLAEAELFTRLDELDRGDRIEIEVYGETLVYEVTESVVVLPTDVDALRPVVGRDLLTLVTCTPIGVNSHRILVTAERVFPDAPAPTAVAAEWSLPWWSIVFAIVLVAAAGFVVRAWRRG